MSISELSAQEKKSLSQLFSITNALGPKPEPTAGEKSFAHPTHPAGENRSPV